MSESALLPKGKTGRKHDTMILHIQGLILMVLLILALSSAFGVLGRTIAMEVIDRSGLISGPSLNIEEALTGESSYLDVLTASPYGGSSGEILFKIMRIWGVVGYIFAFACLAAVIVMVILMKKRIAMILADPTPFEKPVRVKKGAFVWLGFLLGAYGAHLFLLKKKKAWIYLGLGIVGMSVPILFLYTSGISFSDAFLACFYEKDAEGCIEMEDYPYWI
ncbi:MAG: hypothetical protein IKP92_02305 [Lachnospiraceae bacterium]|nr:hypothetical protein [Lachnospiraceae bacterium]